MLIVDAYNALHVTGVLPPDLAVGDVESLARLIGGGRRRGERIRLVCDGAPGTEGERGRLPMRRVCDDAPNVEIVYAGRGADADSLIERYIRESSAPRRLTVVSSDRRLRAAARRRRCRWMSSEAFLRSLTGRARGAAGPGRPAEPIPKEDVHGWIREFGVEEAARPGSPGFLPASSAPKRPRSGKNKGDSLVSRLSSAAGGANGVAGGEDRKADEPDLDPALLEALEEWRGRLDPDDLDMSRWLDHHPPPSDS